MNKTTIKVANEGKKVLWFSRHTMTPEQLAALGPVKEVIQIDGTIQTAFELEEDIKGCDVVAIVAPINLQAQFLKIAGDKPVITAISERRVIEKEGGDNDVIFVFQKWMRIKKIEVVTEDFNPED